MRARVTSLFRVSRALAQLNVFFAGRNSTIVYLSYKVTSSDKFRISGFHATVTAWKKNYASCCVIYEYFWLFFFCKNPDAFSA